MRFREWLFNEARMGPGSVRYDAQGRPSFRVSLREGGRIIGLELLRGANYRYSGDLVSDVFGDPGLLEGYKIYSWHSDLPPGAGYGPLFYDIALEIATKNGGHLASATLVNRLLGVRGAKENKGHLGGDTSDAAEGIYRFLYDRRGDVEKETPNLILMNEPDQGRMPWMYEIYRKRPAVLPELIEMNGRGRPVLVSGVGVGAEAITGLNFI